MESDDEKDYNSIPRGRMGITRTPPRKRSDTTRKDEEHNEYRQNKENMNVEENGENGTNNNSVLEMNEEEENNAKGAIIQNKRETRNEETQGDGKKTEKEEMEERMDKIKNKLERIIAATSRSSNSKIIFNKSEKSCVQECVKELVNEWAKTQRVMMEKGKSTGQQKTVSDRTEQEHTDNKNI